MRTGNQPDRRSPARRLVAGLVGLLLCAWPWPAAAKLAEPPAGEVAVAVEAGRLSLEAREAPLEAVLRAVAEAAGIHLDLATPLPAPGSWSFSDLPLEVGLMRLLDDKSSLMLYGPGETDGVWVLTEVRVLGLDQEAGIPKEKTDLWRLDAAPDEAAGLAEGLGGPPEVRRQAVRRLANRPRVGETRQLAALLRADQDPMIRRIAAVGLGRISTPEARLALGAALFDENDLVRRRAAESLGRVGDAEALQPLQRILLEDPDPEVRRTAALALGRLRRMESVDLLVAAQSDEDASVRQAATSALARLEQQGFLADQ